MYNFFVQKENRVGDRYLITGNDYNHIKNVLRMQVGESFLVSSEGKSDLCRLQSFEDDTAVAVIMEENYNSTELSAEIYLFQGLPKSDKLELIIQKAVELGVSGIVPVRMNRCVVKLDDKKKKSKGTRWQAISESAAKQSKRNVIPKVYEAVSLNEVLKNVEKLDAFLVPYENEEGMLATENALKEIKSGMKIGILIGPEGGFDENEIESCLRAGGKVISLGKRILRAETAAITAVAMCMLHIEMRGDL